MARSAVTPRQKLKVAYLIELLKLLPPDAWVCVPDHSGCGCEPDGEYAASTLTEKTDRMGRTLVIIQ